MVETTGRVLPTPTLFLKDSRGRTDQPAPLTPQNGVYDLSRNRSFFHRPASLRAYAVAVIGRDSDRVRFNQLAEFMDILLGNCEGRGMRVKRRDLRDVVVLQGSSSVEDCLMAARFTAVDAAKRAGEWQDERGLLVFCIIDRKGAPEYDTIKRVSETNLGLLTQCFSAQHLVSSKKAGVALGLAMKINAKLGGVNFTVGPSRDISAIRGEETMVLGVDITHPGPGAALEGARSIAAVVGSIDGSLCEYRCESGHLPPRTEIITGLGALTRPLLNIYKAHQTRLPTRLICFRDGVSEGQFGEVALQEIQSLKECLKSFEGGERVKLTFLVVNKRHGVRFFVKDSRDADRSGNVPAGTVVDTDIIHPFEYDFFLNSHAGIQGTSRASHYHVLYDENNISADDLQKLTNDMCYLFARSQRAVSRVPAVFYAHLVATRVRCYREGGAAGSDTVSMVSGGGRGGGGVEVESDRFKDVVSLGMNQICLVERRRKGKNIYILSTTGHANWETTWETTKTAGGMNFTEKVFTLLDAPTMEQSYLQKALWKR
ncbi:hypothetical protein HDU67_005211 [Dinochytrium kinnereticum]|nr:hypothetical protein HDU67_005211 [Dinochytrium kinnereticum]